MQCFSTLLKSILQEMFVANSSWKNVCSKKFGTLFYVKNFEATVDDK